MKDTTQEKIKKLESYANDLTKEMNDISIDFIGDNTIENNNYICDSFTEYADERTSIYYSDQKEYYYSHTEQCESDLLELYDKDSLADLIQKEGLEGLICKAGVCGEFMQNERDLYEDQDNIVKVLLINYIIEIAATRETSILKTFSADKLIEIVDQSEQEQLDTWDEYLDYLKAHTY